MPKYPAMAYCHIFVDSSYYKAGHSYTNLHSLSLFQKKSLAVVWVDCESSKSVVQICAVGPHWHPASVNNAVRSEVLPCYEAIKLLLLLLWPTDCSSTRGMYLYGALHFFFSEYSFVKQGKCVSYFRHELVLCFPNNCTVELFGTGKNRIKCVKN